MTKERNDRAFVRLENEKAWVTTWRSSATCDRRSVDDAKSYLPLFAVYLHTALPFNVQKSHKGYRGDQFGIDEGDGKQEMQRSAE